ncbi:MAG: choice-of-anchor D domain-containing protein [Persicimonas sp.]
MSKYRLFTFASTLLLGLVLAACGSNFGESEIGQLNIDGDSERELIAPPDDQRAKAQDAITLENNGNGDLNVSRLELVNTPDRLKPIQSSNGESCTHGSGGGENYDVAGDCDENQICWRETTECRPLEMHEAPLTIESDDTLQVGLVVLPSDETGFECDPSQAPEGAPDNYCGHLEIETDANNDNSIVEGGNAKIYFTATPKSGEIQVEPGSLSIAGVDGGETVSADLDVSNTHADEPLTILDASFSDNSDQFDFSGIDGGDEIAAGESADVQVDFTAPDDWGQDDEADDEQLNTVLQIDSTARNENSTNVSINASNSYDLPALTTDPNVLRFHDEAEQTVTLTNDGTARLVLRSVSADPPSVLEDYEFTLLDDGEEPFDGSNFPDNSHVLREDESVDVRVEFTGSDGGVGTLDFNYSYDFNNENRNGSADALLLGDTGDGPIGMATPYTFNFSNDEDEVQERSFAVRNVGTETLDITDYKFQAIGCNPAEDDCDVNQYSVASDAPDTIEPNGLEEVTFEFDPDEATHDRVDMTLDSNTDGPADQMLLSLLASSDDAPIDGEAVITAGFGEDTATVGEEALFSADQSSGVDEDILEGAEWILLDRPDSSEAFVYSKGGEIGFVPDVAGDYKIGLILTDGDASRATTYEFEATE